HHARPGGPTDAVPRWCNPISRPPIGSSPTARGARRHGRRPAGRRVHVALGSTCWVVASGTSSLGMRPPTNPVRFILEVGRGRTRTTGRGNSGRAASASVSLPVRTTPESDRQIREINDWWRRNPPTAPDLFLHELTTRSRSSVMHTPAKPKRPRGSMSASCPHPRVESSAQLPRTVLWCSLETCGRARRAVLEWLRLDEANETKGEDVAVFSNAAGEPVRHFRKAWETTILRANGHQPEWEKGSNKPLTQESHAAFRGINLHWHELRHEYAPRQVDAGRHVTQVRDLL